MIDHIVANTQDLVRLRICRPDQPAPPGQRALQRGFKDDGSARISTNIQKLEVCQDELLKIHGR